MSTQTEIWSRANGTVVVKAVVRDSKGRLVGVTNQTREVVLSK